MKCIWYGNMPAGLRNKVNDKGGGVRKNQKNVILVIMHPFHEVNQLQMVHNVAILHLHVN